MTVMASWTDVVTESAPVRVHPSVRDEIICQILELCDLKRFGNIEPPVLDDVSGKEAVCLCLVRPGKILDDGHAVELSTLNDRVPWNKLDKSASYPFRKGGDQLLLIGEVLGIADHSAEPALAA